MIDEYFTISGETENCIVIERSKFICNIKGVENEEQAKEFVRKISKQHSLATHNCYAYIADENGLTQKFSDDGEPQGTAGLPMLEVLKNKKIFKAVVVVTRYFGGVKLGTGGLVRAYGNSVVECLKKCKILCMMRASFVKLSLDYDKYSKILSLLNNEKVEILSTEFDNDVKIEFAIKEKDVERVSKLITDTFNGKVNIKPYKNGYHGFNV